MLVADLVAGEGERDLDLGPNRVPQLANRSKHFVRDNSQMERT